MKNLADVKLVHGTPLVITGPQGCGKTRLANAIAMKHGSVQSIIGFEFDDLHLMRDILVAEPRTLIVEEPPRRMREWLKTLITAKETSIRKPYASEERRVRTPHIIFCTQQANWFRDGIDRRFMVIRLDENGHGRLRAAA